MLVSKNCNSRKKLTDAFGVCFSKKKSHQDNIQSFILKQVININDKLGIEKKEETPSKTLPLVK